MPDVADDVEALTAAAADAGIEAAGEHEVGEPERDAEHRDGAEGPERGTQPVAMGDGDEDALGGEHERSIRMGRNGGQDRQHPERPGFPPTALDRAQQREIGECAGEQEEAVHPPVDPVEEEVQLAPTITVAISA